MTTMQIADNTFPQLQLQDTVGKALELMDEFKINHLPVVSEEKYLGLVSEEILEDYDQEIKLDIFQNSLIQAAVKADNHFLKAASVYNLYQVSMVPVINDNQEFLGSISSAAIIKATGNFSGSSEYGAIVVLEIDRNRFALSEINSIIESDGATIMHMNVAPSVVPQLIEVTLQINKKEVATIIATFTRYEYVVLFSSGEELSENDINTNYHNLMNYLDI